ncbi:MAG TPA: glyoxylate/hydroxypyruvate reductase A [Gammaproteobacteria bacterium]|nr:glyoxylate/hydroxypyruvate reductase A [Gammaproteobacteria bacterium]
MVIALLIGRDEKEKKSYDWFIEDISRQLLNLEPSLDLRIWPDIGKTADIDFALVWRHPLGALKKFPHLKCIGSLSAGVDHLITDPELSKETPILRVMDPHMANDIVQYVLTYVLHDVKRVSHWEQRQKKKIWAKQPPFNFGDKTIGIMGLGFLGKKIAEALQFIGLNVIGWSSSRKNFPHLKDFAGKEEFFDFLSQTDILVCMLPLTPATKNILNHDTFSQLKPNACLINLGRGEHLLEKDLLAALDSKKLHHAYLDVFSEEPLPSDHPFWEHPDIHVTPHVASVTQPKTAVPQLLKAYKKLLNGEAVVNLVDLKKGY